MSLDDLQLSPYLMKEMYGSSLIASIVKQHPEKEKAIDAETTPVIKFLGNNKRNILIAVNEKEKAFLSDDNLQFLVSVLKACKISLDDVAVVNCSDNPSAVYNDLNTQLAPVIVLFLGTEPQDLGFPVQIPKYRIQNYNGGQYLCAASLTDLGADKEQKKEFWNALKELFKL